MSCDRVAGAEQAALERLLEQRHDRAGQLDVQLGRVGEAGEHDGAALADRVERRGDDLRVDHADGEDRLVGADAAGQLGDQLVRLLGGREACVAPSSSAVSRLFSSGSTAMTFCAPASAAPCTALMPMPPMP